MLNLCGLSLRKLIWKETEIFEYKNKTEHELFQTFSKVAYLDLVIFFLSKSNKFQLPKILPDSVLDIFRYSQALEQSRFL